MDDQTLFNWILALFAGSLGWWLKTLHARVHHHGEKIAEIQVLVAGKYVTREEQERRDRVIFEKLDRIGEKLDRKVDKGE